MTSQQATSNAPPVLPPKNTKVNPINGSRICVAAERNSIKKNSIVDVGIVPVSSSISIGGKPLVKTGLAAAVAAAGPVVSERSGGFMLDGVDDDASSYAWVVTHEEDGASVKDYSESGTGLSSVTFAFTRPAQVGRSVVA